MKITLICLLVVALLSGCKAREVMMESCVQVRTDTVWVRSADTVREVRQQVVWRDSVVRDSVVVERDSAGAVVYVERWRDRMVRVELHDSVDWYRAMVDSLRCVSKDYSSEVRTEVVVERKVDRTGWWAFVVLSTLVGGVAYYFLRR